ncbi:aminoacyl-tRNA hydrolase [Parasphaerochaeta coccoides]|uniref:Peptidyl-tRNA hydrolase n=1 Tax=Parasphaerochaeta coccoides (strain ATCC BAA-1237 / DSM 17374 / SPN1) TaxID=760011 RepID=F4GIR2_PARC1|nr:aminoacyl-tRNA hydrolase [Parasphaerochaeta coccoides]AEC02196.1 peptidyl-tRNA hydrolase [Parasphaerochaeta coccoides DSM 17374]
MIACGLGNPGTEYEHTRHNVGFDVVATVAAFLHVPMRKRFCRPYERGDGFFSSGTRFVLMRPLTFMNGSGRILKYVQRLLRLPGTDLIVVCDQMDLPCGSIRIRKGGKDAGHRGLKSIIQHYGSEDFIRLYIGVGRPSAGTSVVEHVLSRPAPDEVPAFQKGIARGADALAALLAGRPLQEVMNEFNGKIPD